MFEYYVNELQSDGKDDIERMQILLNVLGKQNWDVIKIEKATGLLAQVLQHETDHLLGKLYIDYLENKNG